jgi:alkylation response protein AidB-like acyl-CoA dehydrogenase
MDLHPTDDQLEIISSAADYLGREFPPTRMPRLAGAAPTAAEWRGLADMGWFGMGLSEADGGLGLSIVEEALVLREFGRVLAPPSSLATVLAGHLAAAAGDAALVEALVSGASRAGFAVPANADAPDAGGYWLVDADGAEVFVLWTPAGGLLVDREAFAAVAPVKAFDDSLQVLSATGLDAGRARARVESADFQHRARLLAAAMLTGGAEATRDISAEYAKTRQQFGHPIAVFQAI